MKKILVMASVMMLGASGAWALTQAGTQVTNSVQLTYDVNGNSQTDVNATDGNGFVVDRKIDVQVVENDTNKTVDVNPNQQDVELTFIIANQGNDTEKYELSMDQLATDQFDPQNCQLDINDGNGFGAFNKTITIAKETNATVKVQCDIPNTPTVGDDDNGTIRLIATATDKHGRANQCENGDPDSEDDVQNICADGTGTGGDADHDGVHSDNGTYHVKSADLTATKTSCVFWDPVNLNTNPKRIPGAKIRYAIQVTNNGSADADNVETTDTLKGELTYSNAYIREGNCDCGSPSGNTNEGDASTSNNNQDVTLNFETVEESSSECAYIEATIN